MKWVVAAEVIVTLGLFAFGYYSNYVGHSRDEKIVGAVYTLGGFIAFIVLGVTLVSWWGYTVTFRG